MLVWNFGPLSDSPGYILEILYLSSFYIWEDVNAYPQLFFFFTFRLYFNSRWHPLNINVWLRICKNSFTYERVYSTLLLDQRKCHPALSSPISPPPLLSHVPNTPCNLQNLPHLPYPPKLDFLQASYKISLTESISRVKCITDIAILHAGQAKSK